MAQNVSDPDSWIAEHLSGPQQKFADFAGHVYDDGALDRKTKELIAVATASVGRCPHCTEGHIEAAKEAGASEQEVAEALAVAWAQGSGTQVFWMKEDFDDLLGENWRRDFLPEADAAFWDFKSEIFEDGVLPRKTNELLAVAVSCQHRCRHCTRSHIESALEAGASKAEVAEALSVLWVIGGGTHVVWNQEGFEEHLHSTPVEA
jgi:AhpD family alkylhydroperoxidase